jgi:RNA polymerase-binding transcription factor DksA
MATKKNAAKAAKPVKKAAKAPLKKAAPKKAVAAKPVKKAAPKPVAKAKVVAKPAPKTSKPAPKPAPKPVAKKPVVPAKKAPVPAKKAAVPAKKAPVAAKKPEPKKAVAAPQPAAKITGKPLPKPVAEVKAAPVKPVVQVEVKPPVPKPKPKEVKPPKPVVMPKINATTSRKYEPDFTKSILDQPSPIINGPSMRYSDSELQEFRELIGRKLEAAKKELAYLHGLITRKDEMSGDETDNRYMTMEDGSLSMEREQLSQMASRQIDFIDKLEKALVRIENKTYGICRVTGKLIDKARLRAVPHATLSIEAKMGMSKNPNIQ